MQHRLRQISSKYSKSSVMYGRAHPPSLCGGAARRGGSTLGALWSWKGHVFAQRLILFVHLLDFSLNRRVVGYHGMGRFVKFPFAISPVASWLGNDSRSCFELAKVVGTTQRVSTFVVPYVGCDDKQVDTRSGSMLKPLIRCKKERPLPSRCA
jgi:hypothetical protein